MIALERLAGAAILSLILPLTAWFGARHYGAERFEAGRQAAIAERAQADKKAVLARTEKNTAEAVRQVASNTTITEKKHEEIQPVRERIVTRRVYVGSAVCNTRPAATTETEGPVGGDGADPSGRLVRPDVERDLVALKLAVEEDLATGRACQAVLKDEGIVP